MRGPIAPIDGDIWKPNPLPLMVNLIHLKQLWEETIDGSSVVTHKGLTMLAHPRLGWTIASGMWNTLRTAWEMTSETMKKIHDSCTTQERLGCAQIFTPIGHILQDMPGVTHRH